MKHPNIPYVETIIKSFLVKRRFVDWTIVATSFAFFPSRYAVTFTNKKEQKTVAIVTELFDDVEKNDTPFTRRRIKKVVQKEILPNEPDAD